MMHCYAKSLTLLGILLAGCTLATAADTAAECNRSDQLLERFGDQGIDADADGVVTRDEARSFFQGQGLRNGRRGGFGRGGHGHGPRDGRGPLRALWRLEQLESDTPPEQFNLNRFPDADTDGDGTLSDAEWQAFATIARDKLVARMIERHPDLDADNSGDVSDEELASFRESQKQVAAERILSRFPDADTDGDGVLSDEEFKAFHVKRSERRAARLLERHPEADLDGDGTLSRDEMRTFRQQHGKGKGGRHGGWRGQRCKQTPSDEPAIAE